MALDPLERPGPAAPWRDPGAYWPALDAATADARPALRRDLQLDALPHNAHDMLRRADGMPIRVASKSVRVRGVLDARARPARLPRRARLHARRGAVAAPRPSTTSWSATRAPTGARSARWRTDRELAAGSPSWSTRSSSSTSSTRCCAPRQRETIRVCLELDASLELAGARPHRRAGARPVHTRRRRPAALAATIVARPGFRLVGMMAYEAQIAGLGNRPPASRSTAPSTRWMQRAVDAPSCAERRGGRGGRGARSSPTLEFVNGGGTGSLESDRAPTPRSPRSRRAPGCSARTCSTTTGTSPRARRRLRAAGRAQADARASATLLGGGWIASGPPGADRLPQLVWPEGLRMLPREMAGEVQTPVDGRRRRAARGRRPGLAPAHQGGRAERAPRTSSPWSTTDAVVEHAAHLPRRGKGVPVTAHQRRSTRHRPSAGSNWSRAGVAQLRRSDSVRPARPSARRASVQCGASCGRPRARAAGQGGRRRPQLHRHRRGPRRAARPRRRSRRARRSTRERPASRSAPAPTCTSCPRCSPRSAWRWRTWATSTGRRSPARPRPAPTAPARASAGSPPRSSGSRW